MGSSRCAARLMLGAATLLAPTVMAGCTSDLEPAGARVELESGLLLADAPLAFRVADADPGALVTVTVEGSTGRASASADFVADADGVVDVMYDAPVDGSSYAGASGYGLLWQLPAGDGVGIVEVVVSVDGEEIGRRSQERVLASDSVRSKRLTPALDGLSGRYYFPDRATEPQPAVVIFGGSEGGLSTDAEAQLLASHGFPALALAYFDAPGLPPELRRIPVEYFANALAWLTLRPEVDPDRIVPYGISRGSEAALLVASLEPDLAAGAIALAPNGVAVASVADGEVTDAEPAWTWKRRPVPYAQTLRQWWTDPGDAVIDVWNIDGPILLACGRNDRVWSSCSQADDIAETLAERGAPDPTLLAFDNVGHEIGFAPPGVGGAGQAEGEDLQATGRARAQAWQAILDYFADL